MVIGLGTDIIEIERVALAAEKRQFLEKYFAKEEIDYWMQRGSRGETLAGLFAAKEAAAKALGTGFFGFGPKDVVIFHGENGAPYLELRGGAKEQYEAKGGGGFHLSISHHKTAAVAVAILERREGGELHESGKGRRDAQS